METLLYSVQNRVFAWAKLVILKLNDPETKTSLNTRNSFMTHFPVNSRGRLNGVKITKMKRP